MSQTGGGVHEAADALAQVADVLRQSDARKSLAAAGDAEETLRGAGVAVGKLPKSFIDLLSGMSPQELRLLASVNDTLVKEGFVVEGPGGGKVCFF